MTPAEREALIEAAAGAHRPLRPGGRIAPHPAWADLDPAGREEAFRAAAVARRLEAALDPEGLSSTGRRVLALVLGVASR